MCKKAEGSQERGEDVDGGMAPSSPTCPPVVFAWGRDTGRGAEATFNTVSDTDTIS